MAELKTGKAEKLPYSLSRWTDVPAAKWDWFMSQVEQGEMVAFDPRTAIPYRWSLKPDDVFGLIFWTKVPENLLSISRTRMLPYIDKTVVHVTMNDWHEVEKGAPSREKARTHFQRLVDIYGIDSVTWRFSPVPLVGDVVERFEWLAEAVAATGVKSVYVSFLQENDLMPETRPRRTRVELLKQMAAHGHGLDILLCNEDTTLQDRDAFRHLRRGVCEDGRRFVRLEDYPSTEPVVAGDVRLEWLAPPTEGCGCALAVDPFTINETCTLGCHYCLAPDTQVLFSDLMWRPISDVRVGDVLLGFDEEAPGYRKDRKFRETVVEAVWASSQPTVRMISGENDIITTNEHRWFSGTRAGWRATKHLNLNSKLCQLGYVHPLDFTDDYRRGYMAGMTLGDGTMRYVPGQGNGKNDPQPYWRVALADEEPLGRLVAYLAGFGVEAHIRPFNSGSPLSKKKMQKVEVRALGNLNRIFQLLNPSTDSHEYRRGYLAGFYDAEGSYNRNLRVHQHDQDVLTRIEQYARSWGFNMAPEFFGGFQPRSARLAGRLREKIRFLSTIRPALTRKSQDFLGRSVETEKVPVVAIERGPIRDVIDIQTSTHTFFAGGLATHNCYAADKSLAPKKHNTTKMVQLRSSKLPEPQWDD